MKRGWSVLVLALAACGEHTQLPEIERPDVLVITLDTLRADHMSLYGYERDTTPNLDAFADECFVFERAFSNSSFTPPSHASILTGRFPSEHGLMHWKRRLDASVPTAGELFGELSYRTAAFSPMSTLFHLGLDRGFDTTVSPDYTTRANGNVLLAGGAEMNAAALPWLTEGGDPFFAWMHYYDAHRPFAIAGREWASLYRPDGDSVDERVGDDELWYQLDGADRRRIGITPAQTAYIKDRYDGGINQLDERVGELLESLRGAGVLDRAWVVITADHGEVMDEYVEEWFSHDPHLVDENIHVPLLVRPPGGLDAPKRFEQLVQGVDILPTMLDVAGALDDEFSGMSFAPLLRGEAMTPHAYVFADRIGDPMPKKKDADGNPRDPTDVEIRRSRDRKQSLRTETHKLMAFLDRGSAKDPGVFALWDVGAEWRDVQSKEPQVLDELGAMFGEQVQALETSDQDNSDVPDQIKKQLEKMGYIEGEEESDGK